MIDEGAEVHRRDNPRAYENPFHESSQKTYGSHGPTGLQGRSHSGRRGTREGAFPPATKPSDRGTTAAGTVGGTPGSLGGTAPGDGIGSEGCSEISNRSVNTEARFVRQAPFAATCPDGQKSVSAMIASAVTL
jgi:hypothetical protein